MPARSVEDVFPGIRELVDRKVINKITISGFASHKTPQSIYIRPLTVLAGANSAGKTSALKPLLLLKQTLDSPTDPGPILIYGPNVKFTSLDQIFTHTVERDFKETFKISLEMNLGTSELAFSRNQEARLDIVKAIYKQDFAHPNSKDLFILTPGMPSCDIEALIPESDKLIAEEKAKEYRQSVEDTLDRISSDIVREGLDIDGMRDSTKELRPRWITKRERCFLSMSLSSSELADIDYHLINPAAFYECDFTESIKEVIHVPAVRGRIGRNHPIPEVGREFPGTFEEYTAAVIAKWEADDDERLVRLTKSLKELHLTRRVSTRKLNDAEIDLRVARPGLGDPSRKGEMVSLSDVGVGVSYVLPVLVALEAAEPSQTVYIEQPESHLHPRAAYGLAKALVRAANREIRVIVETHSSLLLLHIQTLVARGELKPEFVGLHWFSLGEEGFTSIDFVEPDEHGRVGEWPEDFADVELSAQSEFLRAARAQL